MNLNVQIVPAPAVIFPESFIALVPARDGQAGEQMDCPVCGGRGQLPRRGDSCRRCAGTGKGVFVRAMRADVREDQYQQMIEYLDGLTPDPDRRVQVTIRLHESGGGMTNTGSARIVCGLRGEPLPAQGGVAHCNSQHATFFCHAALVISYDHHRGCGHGSVRHVGVDREARRHIGIFERLLWRFADDRDGHIDIEEVHPSSFVFPSAAVEAARRKARIYHCRSAIYVAEGGARGPSGALTGAGAAYGGMPSPFKGPGIGYEPAN